MGLLDNLRERFGGGYDDYDDDDYYDEYEDEDDEDEPARSGILGNTTRPEAESVAVYTRSGRPLGTNAGAQSPSVSNRPAPARPSTSYSSYRQRREDFENGDGNNQATPSVRSQTYGGGQGYNASGQLPPYVLRAEEYEDVQTVVRRVRTNQPVLLVLNDTPSDIAQRILDFCFGLSFGIGGAVQPVAGKAFVVLPADITIPQSEIDRLISQAR